MGWGWNSVVYHTSAMSSAGAVMVKEKNEIELAAGGWTCRSNWMIFWR